MHLLEFIATSSVLTLMPGPDILYVLAQSLVSGRRAGIAVALGLSSGLLVHTTAAALGLSLLIARSPTLFNIIKYAGIAYLLYMGWKSLRERTTPAGSAVTAAPARSLYKTGITMNLLNPKIIVFFLALFPQFLDRHSATPTSDIFILGGTFALIAVTIFTAVALLAGFISSRLAIRDLSPRILGTVKAVVYWGIAVAFLFS
ncbi:MAG: LysE family translocator [Rikenellaceae bacterium]|nr:LysE family translocator [Rikenellaceae bacterium]